MRWWVVRWSGGGGRGARAPTWSPPRGRCILTRRPRLPAAPPNQAKNPRPRPSQGQWRPTRSAVGWRGWPPGPISVWIAVPASARCVQATACPPGRADPARADWRGARGAPTAHAQTERTASCHAPRAPQRLSVRRRRERRRRPTGAITATHRPGGATTGKCGLHGQPTGRPAAHGSIPPRAATVLA